MSELKERLLSCLRVDDANIEVKRAEAVQAKERLDELVREHKEALEVREAFRTSTAEKRNKLREELRLLEDKERDYSAVILRIEDRKYAAQDAQAAISKSIESLINNRAMFENYSKLCNEFDYDRASELLSTVDQGTVVVSIQEGSVPPRLKVEFTTKKFRVIQRGTGLKSHLNYGPYKVCVDWDIQRYGANLKPVVSEAFSGVTPVSKHPHINYGGALCTGDESIAISNNLLNGNVAHAISLISGCLLFANPASAYVNLNDVDPHGPWSRVVCPHCNEANQTSDHCTHSSHTTFCASCLQEGPVSHCGSCPTCCSKLHVFSLAALDTNTGLNNSGCINRSVR